MIDELYDMEQDPYQMNNLINDLKYKDIKEKLKFEDKDFIQNHDILETILSTQSIGLYINKKDIENNLRIISLDFHF